MDVSLQFAELEDEKKGREELENFEYLCYYQKPTGFRHATAIKLKQ